MPHAMQMQSHRVLPLLALVVCGGCDRGPVVDYSQLGLVEVQGTVTLDSRPLQGAAVLFIDEQDRYSFGLTNAAGQYRLMFNSEKSGVTPGEKRVEISTTLNRLGEPGSATLGAGDPDDLQEATASPPVPDCYNTQSKLSVHITKPDSALDFDLASDCTTELAK